MDLKNFYLKTLLNRPEYVRIKLADIPQQFIDKYKLNKLACDVSRLQMYCTNVLFGTPNYGQTLDM
jgi:hypothetical protein